MALSIKDPETDVMARELAALTGQPITVAVRAALEDRLAAVRARRETVADDTWAIIERGRRRALLDTRTAEEILGYDSVGLPS